MVALIVVGRILLGLAFLVFGIRNLRNIDRLTGVLEAKKIPQARIWILVGIAIQIVGGLAVATGILAGFGAAALIAFVYLAVYWFHDFWRYSGPERIPHEQAWIMNTALAGGLLMVVGLSF